MSTPFNVRSMAAQAGIQTTGGFAVIAECVTLEELEQFAHIAVANAAKNWQQANDRIASEFQDTCHKQAQRIAELEQAARQAMEAMELLRDGLCGPKHIPNAITSLREALEAAHQPAAAEQEPVLVVEREPSYTNRGHFYIGDKPHIDPTRVWKLPIGTKLYTAPQPSCQPLTDAQIAGACLSYRHDFGLLSKQEQESIIFQAREWERALGKEREIGGRA